MKLLHLIGEHVEMLSAPQIVLRPHLVAKIIQELYRIRDFLPDLWKECCTTKRIAQDDAIHMRVQFGQQIIRILIFQRDRARQARDLDLDPV